MVPQPGIVIAPIVPYKGYVINTKTNGRIGMKKSKKSVLSEEELEYFKKNSLDALLYWVNSTTQVLGVNETLTTLTDVTMSCYVEMVPYEQVERVEKLVKKQVEHVFEILREEAKVSVVESDKSNMN